MTDLKAGLDCVAARLGAGEVAGLDRLSAGATQEIWRFDMDGRPHILRRAPGGEHLAEVAIGPEAEAELLRRAAATGVPVPAVRYVLTPQDGLGRGFIMGFVAGETLGHRIVRDDSWAPIRPKLARQCGDILARIHSIDFSGVEPLGTLTPQGVLDQWRARYDACDWPRPVFDLAFRWLYDHCPEPVEPRLAHGDFRNGNLIFSQRGVVGVLDWELAHAGDPHEDLAWICVNSWRFGAIDKPVGGFGEREDLWAGYEAAGGRRVNPDRAHFWEVFGTLRWGVMCAGMTRTFRTTDPTVERAAIARRASETEIDLMRLLAA